MTFKSETRKRHRFIDDTIECTRNFIRGNDLLASHLGLTAYQAHEQLTRRYFIPNMRHGEIQFPRISPADGVPIVALRPGERPLVAPEFMEAYGIRRDNMWRYLQTQGSRPEHFDHVMGAITHTLQRDAAQTPRYFPRVFTKTTSRSPNTAMAATVYTPGMIQEIDFQPGVPNDTKRRFSVLGLSLLGLRYEGDASQLLTPAAFMHEQVHVLRAEQNPILPALAGSALHASYFVEELEACHDGAAAVRTVMQQKGVPKERLLPQDQYQLEVDSIRLAYNAMHGLQPMDFEPARVLMMTLRTLAQDSARSWK